MAESQTSGNHKEFGKELLAKLYIKEGDYVLDLGCGSGYLAKLVAGKVGPEGKVIAIDPDNERIALAKEKYDDKFKNIDFIVADDQTFPEGKYDIIIATSVLHWIKDKEATFKRAYNNLKPNGCFAFTTLGNLKPSRFPDVVEIFDIQTFTIGSDSLHWKSQEYYINLALTTGFEITFVDVFEESCSLRNVESFVEFLHGVIQGLVISVEAVDEVKKRYEGKPFDFSLPCLTVILTKPK